MAKRNEGLQGGGSKLNTKQRNVANAGEGRLNECDPYFSRIESQSIYGGGGIQVVEAGAVDANKIQQLWCI
jgi:hypothetical protein